MSSKIIPNSIGIIMDGNRRWAKKNLLPTSSGHNKGASIFKDCMTWLSEIGIKNAVFYAFSTENQKRSRAEIDTLLKIFSFYLDELFQKDEYKNLNIKLKFIGDLSYFSEKIIQKIRKAEQASQKNTGINCFIALNYGGRMEIINAVNTLICSNLYKNKTITEKDFEKALFTPELPDIDLIIRTGGDMRLSNFLLWQCAYSELFFTPTLFPDFSREELYKIIDEFSIRKRNFGK